ncbi:hypothetical protein EVAR_41024_1 [Eumeta japonica]|uniref:Uncharacterized protein n=1 Tax=Eumeta variegata TaxID=151549 RepID=A0A4C1YY78_EUMVA|nr:hypothetical protein EVAR_41024_1 [Eumeta japonica]
MPSFVNVGRLTDFEVRPSHTDAIAQNLVPLNNKSENVDASWGKLSSHLLDTVNLILGLKDRRDENCVTRMTELSRQQSVNTKTYYDNRIILRVANRSGSSARPPTRAQITRRGRRADYERHTQTYLSARDFARVDLECLPSSLILNDLAVKSDLVRGFNSGPDNVPDIDPGHAVDSDSGSTIGFNYCNGDFGYRRVSPHPGLPLFTMRTLLGYRRISCSVAVGQ